MAGVDILLQLLPLAYFGGYALLPRQIRLERESYILLPNAAAQTEANVHLLQDEDGPEHEQNTNSESA